MAVYRRITEVAASLQKALVDGNPLPTNLKYSFAFIYPNSDPASVIQGSLPVPVLITNDQPASANNIQRVLTALDLSIIDSTDDRQNIYRITVGGGPATVVVGDTFPPDTMPLPPPIAGIYHCTVIRGAGSPALSALITYHSADGSAGSSTVTPVDYQGPFADGFLLEPTSAWGGPAFVTIGETPSYPLIVVVPGIPAPTGPHVLALITAP